MTNPFSMQIKIWTSRPSELLQACDFRGQKAIGIMARSHFNGMTVVITDLFQGEFIPLENAAVRLQLRYDASQEADHRRLLDNRFAPVGASMKALGTHDAEIQIWYLATLSYPYTVIDHNLPEHSSVRCYASFEDMVTNEGITLSGCLTITCRNQRQRNERQEGYLGHIDTLIPWLFPKKK